MLLAVFLILSTFIVPVEKFTDDKGNTFEGNNLNLDNNTLNFGNNSTQGKQILSTICGLATSLIPDPEYKCHKF